MNAPPCQPAILIVDDHPANIVMLADLLTDDYRILAANNGEKALQIMHSQPEVGLVLLDVMMEGMDGYEVCRQLKEDPVTAPVPVIFVTGKDSDDDEQLGFDVGGVDFIRKPFCPQVVRTRVDTHLALFEMQRKLEQKVASRTLKLERAMEAAQEANRVKDRFLANMSHELRTPLNIILGNIDLLQQSEPDDERRHRLSAAGRAARSLSGLVSDLLDLTRLETHGLQTEHQAFSLTACLEGVMRAHEAGAHKHRVQVTLPSPPEQPDALVADPGLIGRILGYLLDNAIKFSPPGGTVRIDRELRKECDTWCLHLSVTDEGIGIEEDQRETLFQAFTQADDSTQRRYGGTGMGLRIAKHLTGLLGGEIGCNSKPGKGSTFHFSLPVEVQPGQTQDSRGTRTEARHQTEDDTGPVATAEPADLEQVRPVLRQLEALVLEFDTDSLEQAQQLARLLRPTRQAATTEQLSDAIATYDFERAETLLRQLDTELSG
jgi:signal transduction histidine kinase